MLSRMPMGSFLSFRSVILGIFLFGISVFPKSARADLDCQFIYHISQGYLNQHISFDKESANLEQRTISQYVEKLDVSKIYLLQSDVDKIKSALARVFANIRNQNCKPLVDAQDILIQRVDERVNFAKEYLGPSFKYDPKTEITLDPEKRVFPKDKKEADEFQKKYIQFQVSNYIATKISVNEARANVLKSYERVQKRIKAIAKDDIYANYLDAFARSLDPHSSFFSRDVLEDFEISMKLSLEGIGATLTSQDGFTVVDQLIPGGAAQLSGKVKPKDKITAVGQGDKGAMENVIDMDLRDVVKKIRGEKGTKVRLLILRKSEKAPITVTLVRNQIRLEDEAASITYLDREVNGEKKKIGLLNLPSFYSGSRKGERSSADDVKKILKEAKEKKVDALVLDLSFNGGGSLEDAVKISGLFFKTGNVVKQSSRDPSRSEIELRDEDSAVDYSGPLVILTSRISASASEIVAGTLKDYRRAVVVGGDHTFGKGSVQSVIPLPRKLGALKVTVGMFFTPGGNSTQHRGVDSDVVFPSLYSTDEIGEKTLDYSLPPKRLKSFISNEAFVNSGEDAWKPIAASIIDRLKETSKNRIENSKEFKKIAEDIKKNETRGKTIVIADLMKEREDREKEKDKGKDKEKDKDKEKALAKAESKIHRADVNKDIAPHKGDSLSDDAAEVEISKSREEKKKEYLERAEVQEAVSVAADLAVLLSGKSLSMANKAVAD